MPRHRPAPGTRQLARHGPPQERGGDQQPRQAGAEVGPAAAATAIGPVTAMPEPPPVSTAIPPPPAEPVPAPPPGKHHRVQLMGEGLHFEHIPMPQGEVTIHKDVDVSLGQGENAPAARPPVGGPEATPLPRSEERGTARKEPVASEPLGAATQKAVETQSISESDRREEGRVPDRCRQKKPGTRSIQRGCLARTCIRLTHAGAVQEPEDATTMIRSLRFPGSAV